ncbi:MAG TPA: hypothetical protein VFF73_20680 [Planctomycetota bacterium]|nr:hypothetical protein [Planctomycetota bacterium]
MKIALRRDDASPEPSRWIADVPDLAGEPASGATRAEAVAAAKALALRRVAAAIEHDLHPEEPFEVVFEVEQRNPTLVEDRRLWFAVGSIGVALFAAIAVVAGLKHALAQRLPGLRFEDPTPELVARYGLGDMAHVGPIVTAADREAETLNLADLQEGDSFSIAGQRYVTTAAELKEALFTVRPQNARVFLVGGKNRPEGWSREVFLNVTDLQAGIRPALVLDTERLFVIDAGILEVALLLVLHIARRGTGTRWRLALAWLAALAVIVFFTERFVLEALATWGARP